MIKAMIFISLMQNCCIDSILSNISDNYAYYNIWSQMHKPKNNQQWQNLTSRHPKYQKSYLLNSPTAISHVSYFQLTPTIESVKNQRSHYVSLCTFDGIYTILQNDCDVLVKKSGQDPQFTQIVKFKVDFPILHSQIQFDFFQPKRKDHLIAYLIDIYSNIYVCDITANKEGLLINPIKYTKLYLNHSERIIEDPQLCYLETPLFLRKTPNFMSTINLAGELRLIFPQNSKFQKKEEVMINFQKIALAAAFNKTKYKSFDSILVIAINNNRIPYLFINCKTPEQFLRQKRLQQQCDWIDDALQITFIAVDSKTGLVCTSSINQAIDIYQIAEYREGNILLYYLKKKIGLFAIDNVRSNPLILESNIEYLSACKGIACVVTSKEYIFYDLRERAVKKRGKGTSITCMKWGQVMDYTDRFISVILIKGYNHLIPSQSKANKPNIHFKNIDYISKKG